MHRVSLYLWKEDDVMLRFKKTGNLILILAFFLCITVPALFSDKTGGTLSPAENRYLAKAPELFSGRRLNWKGGAILQEIDSWINDNTFGRETARSFLSDVHVKLMGDRMDGQMLIAGDWRFLWRDDLPERALHLDLLNGAEQESLRRKSEQIALAMKRRGAGFCVTILPHKLEICGKYLPGEVRIAENPCISEQLLGLFGESETVAAASPYRELRESMEAYENGQGPLTYYQAFDGSHWNWRGAFIGYRAMMENIRSIVPELMILEEKDYSVTPNQVETVFRGRSVTEEDSVWSRAEERQARREDSILNRLAADLQDPWKANRAYINEQHPEYPKAVIVGDSYLWMFFLDDIADSFSELIYINIEDAGSLFSIVDQFQPDVVAYAGIRLHSFINLVNVPE